MEIFMDQLAQIFAQNLIRLRMSRHITQLELASRINYSDKAVSRWERAHSIPDAAVLLQLSEFFGVTVDYLLHEHSQEPYVRPEEGKRINYKAITLISVLGVFTLALFTFIVLYLLGHTVWMTFVYALPVALIVWLVLNSVWNKRKYNIFIISALMWSILAALYLSFLVFMHQNWWMLFLLGIPAQLIIMLGFRIRIKNIKNSIDSLIKKAK